ncbi:hypothetical protein BDK51DRAFT_33334 [Blyttiomyces helicus]|uniref:Pentacotripeptide-repeat region of PRORP domain-containing protein n=1 Tax=Blyttiomyces helicus TaxID=388810 RepID=A0A4P9VVR7_9FUNG|nr:hypothetical protein BDK51DRAFT_33334 [Blyttiomyces helicus]|eukprot:RKO83761.1 hypothetical protein BDK51DRAFT_33334 [Blyttiomyces helicus]
MQRFHPRLPGSKVIYIALRRVEKGELSRAEKLLDSILRTDTSLSGENESLTRVARALLDGYIAKEDVPGITRSCVLLRKVGLLLSSSNLLRVVPILCRAKDWHTLSTVVIPMMSSRGYHEVVPGIKAFFEDRIDAGDGPVAMAVLDTLVKLRGRPPTVNEIMKVVPLADKSCNDALFLNCIQIIMNCNFEKREVSDRLVGPLQRFVARAIEKRRIADGLRVCNFVWKFQDYDRIAWPILLAINRGKLESPGAVYRALVAEQGPLSHPSFHVGLIGAMVRGRDFDAALESLKDLSNRWITRLARDQNLARAPIATLVDAFLSSNRPEQALDAVDAAWKLGLLTDDGFCAITGAFIKNIPSTGIPDAARIFRSRESKRMSPPTHYALFSSMYRQRNIDAAVACLCCMPRDLLPVSERAQAYIDSASLFRIVTELVNAERHVDAVRCIVAARDARLKVPFDRFAALCRSLSKVNPFLAAKIWEAMPPPAAADANMTLAVMNTIIFDLAKEGSPLAKTHALRIFDELVGRHGVIPNQFTRSALVLLHSRMGEMDEAVRHLEASRLEFGPPSMPEWGALVSGYLATSRPDDALAILAQVSSDGLDREAVRLYASVMHDAILREQYDAVETLWEQMRSRGVPANAGRGDIAGTKAVVELMTSRGIEPNDRTRTEIVVAYAVAGDEQGAAAAAAKMHLKLGAEAWQKIAIAYAKGGRVDAMARAVVAYRAQLPIQRRVLSSKLLRAMILAYVKAEDFALAKAAIAELGGAQNMKSRERPILLRALGGAGDVEGVEAAWDAIRASPGLSTDRAVSVEL